MLILRNRAVNTIEHIKHLLRDDQDMTLYNDLLILQQIVPGLCKQTLRELLGELRKIERSLQQQPADSVSMAGVVELLASTRDPDPLLEVFLRCTVH